MPDHELSKFCARPFDIARVHSSRRPTVQSYAVPGCKICHLSSHRVSSNLVSICHLAWQAKNSVKHAVQCAAAVLQGPQQVCELLVTHGRGYEAAPQELLGRGSLRGLGGKQPTDQLCHLLAAMPLSPRQATLCSLRIRHSLVILRLSMCLKWPSEEPKTSCKKCSGQAGILSCRAQACGWAASQASGRLPPSLRACSRATLSMPVLKGCQSSKATTPRLHIDPPHQQQYTATECSKAQMPLGWCFWLVL